MPRSDSIAELPAALRAATDPVFVRKLDRLRLNVTGGTGSRPGNNRVANATQATGLEVAKHQQYVPGDDLRYLDWNAYARLDEKLVKTFRAEREAPLHLLIDASASMGAPATDGKLAFAAALAASLAYVSLRHRDPVRCAALQGMQKARLLAPLLRHPDRLPLLRSALAALRPEGPTVLTDGVDAYLRATRQRGLVIVLSDFLVPAPAYQAALERLRGGGHAVAAVRLLGPAERQPRADTRRVRIRDVESGRERHVELSAQALQAYAARLEEHTRALRDWCAGRSIPVAVADPSTPLEQCLLSDLPRAGLLH
jgi:uncharacterized protein (DUF58 family)